MGIPLWESPPTESRDKSVLSSRCHTTHRDGDEPRIPDSPSSSSSSTDTLRDGATPRRNTNIIGTTSRRADSTTSRRADGTDNTTTSMLTLDEFLRETSQASAASNEAERHLQTLLLMHRERRAGTVLDYNTPPRTPTTAGSGGGGGGGDSFDTLVTQIRRIGALQDAMLSTVDNTTTTLEDFTRRERNWSAVDSLRVREARLRAMQTRIDLLASEFQLLRSTRRELRRVEQQAEQQALGFQGSRPALGGEAEGTERPSVRPAFLQQPESTTTPAPSTNTPTTVVATAATTTASATEASPATPAPVDRTSVSMTEDERDLMLRNAVIQMQIEGLAAAPGL